MNRVSIIMYHYVRPIADSDYPGIKGLELDDFVRQLQFLREQFCVVSMENVIDSLNGKTQLPENAVLLTFDDGYMDHYQYVFPVLKEYGMQGSFFVPSGILRNGRVLDVNKIHYILACADLMQLLPKISVMLAEYREKGYKIEPDQELYEKLAVANRWDPGEVIYVKRLLQTYLDEEVRRDMVNRLFLETVQVSEQDFSGKLYMNMDQIKEMRAAGMFFGLHGENHEWLNRLPQEKMKQDIDLSLDYFSEVIDRDYLVINYPYGGYDQKVLDYAGMLGCRLGLTVEAGCADLDQMRKHPLALPRFDTNDFPPKSQRYRDFVSAEQIL